MLCVGLYTSPHLVAVRERIRINGVPISEELFTKFFFDVWDRLEENQQVCSSFNEYINTLTLQSDFNKDTKANVFQICHPHGIPRVFDLEGWCLSL